MTLEVALVAADRVVWSGEARELIARTTEGDLGILTGHAPLLSVLVPGVVEIVTTEGPKVYAAVEEGFLSVANDRISVLSEDAWLATEIDAAAAQADLAALGDDADPVLVQRAEAKVRAAEKA